MNAGTYRSILALSLAALMMSCARHQADLLRVSSALPHDTVPATSAIQISFSRGVVPLDSVNVWTTTPFVEFTPVVEGKFVWQDTARLVFSPDQPFAGDTRFHGTLNTALLTRLSGAKGFSGPDEFDFNTESFRLIKAEFFYDRVGEKRQVGIKANLEFTYAVNPQDIQSNIRLTVDDAAQTIARVNTVERNRLIALEVGTITQTEKPRKISVSFDDQLVSPETETHIKTDRPIVFTLPPLAELQIYGHEFGYDGSSSWIRVRTSQEVESPQVESHVSLEPVRDFTVTSDGQGFTIRGKFEPGTSFRMIIKKGMESVLGGRTQNDYAADIVIGDIAPSFRFASASGVYMLLGGQKKIEIKTINLSKLNVRVSQIFQNNLVFFLDGGRSYDYYYYDDEGDDESGSGSTRRKYRYYVGNYGRQLKFDSIDVKGTANQEVTTLFDLDPFLHTGYKGFYLVEIANPAEAWRSTSKLIALSNIGLIVKGSADEVSVFATSLETNEPLSGVLISLISTNNQVMGSKKTDGDGVARFTGLRDIAREFRLKLVTAEADDDFNFINLQDYRVETSRFDVAGKRDAESRLDAFLYGDRTIYRPGETVYLSGIVRNLTHELPAKMPVRLKIYNPQATVVADQQLSLNEEGSFETRYATVPTSLTGEYRAELSTGTGVFLADYKVSVEDFVPDRLKVSITPSRPSAKPGETIRYEVEALNFFGPPAAGRKWEFEGSFAPLPFRSKAFPDFRFFDDGAANYTGNPDVFTGTTDARGRAVIDYQLPATLTSTGLLQAKGRIAVFDESGRPVYQISRTLVYPKQYFIGIRNPGAYYVNPGTPQKVQLVAVDAEDRPIRGFKAAVELVRREWHSVLRQHPGTHTLRYVSELREVTVKSDHITLADKPTEYTYVVPRSGDYVVRVSKEGGNGYNQFSFYAYSWGTSDITSFEVDPEARVEIVFDKARYQPGDKAKILFQTPFDGEMLVTVERNQLFSYRYLHVKGNAAAMELSVEDRFLPNVYVAAVLFRKIKEQNIPLLAGHGFAPLMVEKIANRIEVAVSAPEKIRPKTKQTVLVRTGEKSVYVTLAAVDEGICQLKNYQTPDPYGYFYAKKALETETYDFFRDLIPEPDQSRVRSSAGGGEAEMARHLNPVGVQRFRPVALWSGILRTDASGEAKVTLDVPEFNGELRLMALAYKGDRFGAAARGMKVTDPVVISAALPRFLSPNDSLNMPITAFNTTAKPVSLRLSIETQGGLNAAKSASLEVGPNQERYVDVALTAGSRIGKASVKIGASAFGETMETTTQLPVRPISPYVSDAVSGQIDGGTPVSHDIPDVYLPYNRRAYLTLSPFPVAGFARELKYLVGYPHGCLEQTVSKAFPQIYLRDIAALMAPTALNTGSPTYFVNEAITKLGTMQRFDGTFEYWPGGGYANDWASVYATHFLLEARKAGYEVGDALLKPALAAAGRLARSKKTEDYYWYEQQKTSVRRIADKSVMYALYVLAAAGLPEKSVMEFYRNEKSLLTLDTRYLLAGAYALSGDRRTYTELLPAQFTIEEPRRTSGWNFDSPVRANAVILNVLLETDLNDANIPRYMEYLAKAYRVHSWYSTQDDAFTLLAFGKAARMASATTLAGTVTVGDKTFAYKGGNHRIDIEPYGKKVTVSLKGEGRVYYSLVTEGIRSDGAVRIEDKNLQVRREFFDRTGAPVNPGAVRQNELIIVKIVLRSSVDRLDNVAVTDLLPAGFEIENPRIVETTAYPFIKNATEPDYMDIRDDRINVYTGFRGGNRQAVFYYVVRAVTQGTFEYPPIVAEAMYDGDYYSASAQGKLRVLK